MRENMHPTHQEMLRRRDEANAATNPSLAQIIDRAVLNDLFPVKAFPPERVAPKYDVEVCPCSSMD